MKKSALDRIREDVKTGLDKSKGIVKERNNFVRINMMKNYKPMARGGVFQNKLMAKKKNVLKSRENFKRKM